MTQGENVNPCPRKKTKKRGKQKEKIPNQRARESKKEKKGNSRSRIGIKIEEICRKVFWTRQYLNNIELSPRKQKKEGNHDLKWSSPFDYQPKSCALATFSPRNEQEKKGKGQEYSKPNFPRKNPIDPWSRM